MMISTGSMFFITCMAMLVSIGGVVATLKAATSVKTKAVWRVRCWSAAAYVLVATYIPASLVWMDVVDLVSNSTRVVDPWSVNMPAQWAYFVGCGIALLLVVVGWCFKYRPTPDDKLREALNASLRYSTGMYR